jgi:hypothetical protein
LAVEPQGGFALSRIAARASDGVCGPDRRMDATTSAHLAAAERARAGASVAGRSLAKRDETARRRANHVGAPAGRRWRQAWPWMSGPGREHEVEPGRLDIGPSLMTHAPDQARAVASEVFEVYGTTPSYRAMLDRDGVAGPAENARVGDAPP